MSNQVDYFAVDELVVCSLEAWDEVWRRNQILVDVLLRTHPQLRVLFIEPLVDVPYELFERRWPPRSGLRDVRGDQRLFAARPRKFLPRVIAGTAVERHCAQRVLEWTRQVGFSRPVLWVNDDSYAVLAEQVDWPTLQDMTDDWLAASASPRELRRRRRYEATLSVRAEVRVAVSARLVESRGAPGTIRRIPDGVDVEHFVQPQDRPTDIPAGPYALYVGTLHEDRLDLDLIEALAGAIAPNNLIFVGPNAMAQAATRRLRALPNCVLLGARPYEKVPAYYQHAEVIVIPHRVTDFTESLDPIKAHECIAVGKPTVATPVAGFRELGPPVELADAASFPRLVRTLIAESRPTVPGSPVSWIERAEEFHRALCDAVRIRAERTVRSAGNSER